MTRKQSARRPAPSTAKWALLAEAGLPAAVVSASGRLQQTSASLRELLGYTAKELRTLRFADLTHPGVAPEGDWPQAIRSGGKRRQSGTRLGRRGGGKVGTGTEAAQGIVAQPEQARPRPGLRRSARPQPLAANQRREPRQPGDAGGQ